MDTSSVQASFTCLRGNGRCGEHKNKKKIHAEKTTWNCVLKSF